MYKFKNISYPIFCLKNVPFRMIFKGDALYIQQSALDAHQVLLDDRAILKKSYLQRLTALELENKIPNRVKFEYTCRDLQELIQILPPIKWGIDSDAKIYDFSKKNMFIQKCKKIRKIKDNFYWLEGISYPFVIHTKEQLNFEDNYYVTVVNINNEWHPIKFSMEKNDKRTIWL